MNKLCKTEDAHPAFARALAGLPRLPRRVVDATVRTVPDDTACFALWDKFDMLPNIRRHSLLVAHIATTLARRAAEIGIAVNVEEVRASGLLHDIAKTYCVRHGGSHAQVGASWVVSETGNQTIAQGVLLHVWWPWIVPQGSEICTLPFFVLYADKRVRHDTCVTLQTRYDDLLDRYGLTQESRQSIDLSYQQGKKIERALEAQLELSLHENSFDCGRMVS